MNIQGIHHAAYRCKNAKQTVEFYQQVLAMDFQLAIAEDRVPSTGEPDPYMHVFMDAGNGNVLAFLKYPILQIWGLTPTRRSGCSISPLRWLIWMHYLRPRRA